MKINYSVQRQVGESLLTIRGCMAGPETSDVLVVVCHGLMMTCDHNPVKWFADKIASLGYQTLKFDFIGNGVSDGYDIGMSPLTEVEDLRAVLTDCKQKFPNKKLIVIGHSLGGVVSLLLASECQFLFDGLVLLAPALVIEDECSNGRIVYESFDKDNIPDFVEVWGGRVGRPYFIAGATLGVYSKGPLYTKTRVCLIQGDEDVFVPVSYSQKLAQLMPNLDLHIIRGGDHNFIRPKVQTLSIIEDYLKSIIR